MPLENFLEVIQPRSRYLTCSPNIALSTGEKIKTIRHVDQKIFKKNKIFVHKKKPSPGSTVVFAHKYPPKYLGWEGSVLGDGDWK